MCKIYRYVVTTKLVVLELPHHVDKIIGQCLKTTFKFNNV